jgi:tRNA1Val (adenine37-N6)-methyltransferase
VRISEGGLLGGRVRYAQPSQGFRSGIEPVFLAAAVPARSGERVLEAGSGAGAALLCLAARVPDIAGLGVERDGELAALATHNATANGFSRLQFVAAPIGAAGALGGFNHALANPPYHPQTGTTSPDPVRRAAKQGPPELLSEWVRSMAAYLQRRGTLTLVVQAPALPAAIAALATAGCQPSALFPLWRSAGESAKLVLLRGVKGGRGPFRLLAGLALHRHDGGFTPDADAVLRAGAGLDLE